MCILVKHPHLVVIIGSSYWVVQLRYQRSWQWLRMIHKCREWNTTLIASSRSQHGARLGPTGPKWAPCWPQDLSYVGMHIFVNLHPIFGAIWHWPIKSRGKLKSQDVKSDDQGPTRTSILLPSALGGTARWLQLQPWSSWQRLRKRSKMFSTCTTRITARSSWDSSGL